jgi:hypothetical protein
MKYSKGVMWLDDCRIPFVENGEKPSATCARKGGFQDLYVGGKTNNTQQENTQGRFTPNLLVCDDMLNDGSVVKSSNNWSKKTTLQSPYFTDEKQEIYKDTSYGDKGTNSRYYDLDLWFDKMVHSL